MEFFRACYDLAPPCNIDTVVTDDNYTQYYYLDGEDFLKRNASLFAGYYSFVFVSMKRPSDGAKSST